MMEDETGPTCQTADQAYLRSNALSQALHYHASGYAMGGASQNYTDVVSTAAAFLAFLEGK